MTAGERKRRSAVIDEIMSADVRRIPSRARARVGYLLRRERIHAHADGMEEGYLFALREARRRHLASTSVEIDRWYDEEIARLIARGVR